MSDSFAPTSSQESWLSDFQQASPQGRYEHLLTALANPAQISPDDLAYAVANVCQILNHHNLIANQKTLLAQVAAQAPAVYAQLEGITALIELQEALADQRPEAFPALFEICLRAETLPLNLILKHLAYAGYAPIAANFAHSLAGKLSKKELEADEALDFALEQHQIHQVFEHLLHSLTEGLDPDWEGFMQGLRQLGVRTKQELAFFRDQLESSDKVQLSQLRQALETADPELALFHFRQLFSRWMYRHHRLDLFSSGDMVQQAFEMWLQQTQDSLPTLEKLVKVSPEQIQSWYQALEHEPQWDLLEAFVLLWGLPHVYEWLEDIGLCNRRQREQVLATVTELRADLMTRRANSLWNFSFVHHWPRPQSVSEADFQAEAAHFCQTRQQSTPLSTNPEDSRPFDEAEFELPEELVDSIGAMLAEQGPEVLDELLHELEHQFGPEGVEVLLLELQARGLLELATE